MDAQPVDHQVEQKGISIAWCNGPAKVRLSLQKTPSDPISPSFAMIQWVKWASGSEALKTDAFPPFERPGCVREPIGQYDKPLHRVRKGDRSGCLPREPSQKI